MSIVIGIDLGTTNTCVAHIEDGVPIVTPNKSGYKITPSVVAITPSGKRLIGHAAKRQAITNPTNTVFAAKRFIGRPFNSPQVQSALISCPFQLVEGEHGDVRVKLNEKIYSAQEIQSMILGEMKAIAEEYMGEAVDKAVITVPAYFKDPQRQSTRDAGRIAGLDVIRILNEPTAAALAYGLKAEGNKKIAVYDLGGGTFDISILEISEDVYEVITSNGDTFLGGEDFDSRIMEWLLDEFFQEYGIDLREDKMAIQRLKDAAETAKISLSSSSETEINLPFITTDGNQQPLHLQKDLSRDELEEMVEDLVERTIDICTKALQDGSLHVDAIDDIVLIGGQTRMPMVQNAVSDFFGKMPSKNINPDEAVALGAAIQGEMLTREGGDKSLLLDLTPHPLGIAITGGYFKEIIAKDTPIPVSKSHIFTTETDYQESVRIIAQQGQGEDIEDKIILGEFILDDIKRAQRGETRIKIFFDLDADGTLKVSARDMDTGEQQAITVSAYNYLTDNEIQDMIDDNREYALEQEYDNMVSKVQENVSSILNYIQNTLPALEQHFKGNEKNEAALKNIKQILAKANDALEKKDVEKLVELETFLLKTQSLIKNAIGEA